MAGASATVTLVAVLGGVGLLPTDVGGSSALADPGAPASSPPPALQLQARVAAPTPDSASGSPSATALTTTPEESAPSSGAAASVASDMGSSPSSDVATPAGKGLPAESGTGRRVVFSESKQRVWLVDGEERVLRTYLVSGSVEDNLDPGTFEVFSRSEDAWGIDDSGTMRFFVRFTRGPTGAAIGFHDIPVSDGEPVQSVSDLGTPQSHGCIRQRRRDAIALWEFASIGTTVVVTA